ncbi:hypothetical protein GCM10011339_28150 [Echinicola rosea]|uniref:Uncharacterized protein n=1 Tax=Echinicola rosea TaxID=1807691 RepID=A0ABQ1V5S1_9BACT|nr:hypothetical protein GCM10011339_28150 [Echinicola rosea]
MPSQELSPVESPLDKIARHTKDSRINPVPNWVKYINEVLVLFTKHLANNIPATNSVMRPKKVKWNMNFTFGKGSNGKSYDKIVNSIPVNVMELIIKNTE